MPVGRNMGKQLEIKAQAYTPCPAAQGEEPVIISFSTPKPVSVSVKGHTGHHRYIYTAIVKEPLTHGLPNVVSALTQRGFRTITAQFHLHTVNHRRQQYMLAHTD